MPIKQKKENFLFVFIGLAAILIYGYVIHKHAINMPKWDDFPDILQFMDRWLLANTFSEKCSLFFYHTNEHILLVNHFIILVQYYLLDHIDFRWLIYTGNLFYLGSALILWLPFRNREESAFAFAVLMLTGLTFYAYESTLWAMTALSNQAVIFFSLLTLWYATQASPSLSRIIPLTLVAIFSQSNGFLLLPVVGILFFFFHKKNLAPWLIFSVLIITCYSLLLNPASQQDAQIKWSDIPFHHYGLVLPGFVALFGSTLFNEVNISVFLFSLAIGSAILFLSLKQLVNRQYSPFILSALLFLGLCLASIAFYRGLLGGPSVMFVSRYKMYGIYFLALGLLLSPQWLSLYKTSPGFRNCILLFCLLFFSASFYLNLPKSTLIDGDLRESLEHWVEDGDFRRGKGYFIKDSDSYLFSALHRDIWSPLSLIQPERIIRDITLLDHCPQTNDISLAGTPPLLEVRHINRNAPGIRVELSSQTFLEESEWLVYLCGDTSHYRLRFRSQKIENRPSPVYYIPAEQIAADKYTIYVEFNHQLLATGGALWRKSHTR